MRIKDRIKHKNFDKAKKMLNGVLAKCLTDESSADTLAQTPKIAIDSVYGLTSANSENPFRDTRDKNNIVAKRGALFMVNLRHEIQKQGFTATHIKTGSIKIPDAMLEIIQFIMDYGKKYGYVFEHEVIYDRMCPVSNAAYIAKCATEEECQQVYGHVSGDIRKHLGEWTATSTQLQIPYVFKKLFSKEEILFEDMCETRSVINALYLGTNETLSDVPEYERVSVLRRTAYILNPTTGEEFPGQHTSKKNQALLETWGHVSDEELGTLIEQSHNYIFVGKVGSFCPMKLGYNGGLLLRETVDKKTGEKSHALAGGTKGYHWLGFEMVKQPGKEDDIDRDYYDAMVDAAIANTSKYGDFEWLISNDPYVKAEDDMPSRFSTGEPHEDAATPFDVR